MFLEFHLLKVIPLQCWTTTLLEFAYSNALLLHRLLQNTVYLLLILSLDDYTTHASLLKSIITNKQNRTEISKSTQDFSPESLEVSKSYDPANLDKQNIVRLTLGLPLKQSNVHLVTDAASEIEGASKEDKSHDDALMEDDDF